MAVKCNGVPLAVGVKVRLDVEKGVGLDEGDVGTRVGQDEGQRVGKEVGLNVGREVGLAVGEALTDTDDVPVQEFILVQPSNAMKFKINAYYI